MYDGNQVLRIANKYKKNDLYNIGEEMLKRKGTGNYDKERTKFNVEYVSINEKNLYQEIKQIIKKKNIEYKDNADTNYLNGVTITSGPEFFESLGMKFKDSGRTYHNGDKKGQAVMIPIINSKEDIPNAVTYFFDSCMEFLNTYVGEENIVLAQVHYDEDTPHLQAYFMPVVNEVKRKQYEKDSNGNIVKEEYTKKDGTIGFKYKLLRDNDGKIVYKTEKGLFLNNDQFWKDRGAQYSFSQIQDDFNKFITERGFNLYRGDIGANRKSQTKLEYQIEEKKAELEELNKEKENTLKIIENSKNGLKNMENNKNSKELLNPTKRKIGGYKDEDISNIINYTKDLEKQVTILNTDNENKDIMITKLTEENDTFKSNKELIKRNKLIKEQKNTINSQKKEISRLNGLVDILNNNIDNLKAKLNAELEKWKNRFFKLCNAIDKVLGRTSTEYVEDYEDLADSINNDYYDYDSNEKDKDDFEI